MRLGGLIGLPKAGDYRFTIEGGAGDDVRLFVDGKLLINQKKFSGRAAAKEVHVANKAGPVHYRIEYVYRTSFCGKLLMRNPNPSLTECSVTHGDASSTTKADRLIGGCNLPEKASAS